MTKIKRRRLISSCKYCYEHKIKCDHEFPCANCSKLNKSHCVYNFQKSTNVGKISKSPSKNVVLYTSNALFSYLGTSIKNLFVDNSVQGSFSPNINDTLLGLNQHNDPNIVIDILSKFPKNRKIEDYFNTYWECINCLIPVLHKSNTELKLKKLMETNEQKKLDESTVTNIDVPFLLIALSVFISSLIQECFKNNEPKHIQSCIAEQRQYYEYFEKLLEFTHFPQIPSIEAIQSSLIIFEVASFNYRGINVKVATLTRVLLSMGVNLKEENDKNNPHFVNSQQKRIIWAITQKMDMSSSVWMNTFSTADYFSNIVKIPKPDEHLDYDFNDSENLNVFISYNNMIYELNSQLTQLITYMSVDSNTNYYQLFDFKSFEMQMLALYTENYEWGKNIMSVCQSEESKYDKPTNRWLVANARIMNLRIYILYKYCMSNMKRRQSQSLPTRVNVNNEHTNKNYTDSQSFINLLTMEKPYDDDLIEVVLILLYETRIRLTTFKSTSKFKWNMRNANPFQFLFILLRDIYNQRNKRYNFSFLPKEIMKLCEFDLKVEQSHDIRIIWVDEVLRLLLNFKSYWPASSQEVYELIVKLREFLNTPEGKKGVRIQISENERRESLLHNDTPLSNLFDYQPLDLEYFKIFEM